ALALLRHFEGDPGRILPSKAILLRRIGNGLPGAYRYRPAGDLATEIEWAKNRRLTPDTYRDWLGDHEPPIPADLSLRVFREYERRKDAEGLLDFEDLLERTARLLESDDAARAAVHNRWRAFTVDEYQDVNLLQQSLLDLWLGDRCSPRGYRSSRWRCSCARTRGRASSRRPSTTRGSRSRARRCWRATRLASC